jgi:predicted nucleic acid-binding protein
LRVLIDTSAWIDFFNGFASPERKAVADLLEGEHDLVTCGVVVAEVLQGLRRDRSRAEIATLFQDFAFLEPSGIDLYFRAADVYRALRRRGITVRSTIDCVIATLAEENGCLVLARDRDLETIVGSGQVKVRLWPVDGTQPG